MPTPAELTKGQRIIHPTTEQTVTVDKVRVYTDTARVWHKDRGCSGSFYTWPDSQLRTPKEDHASGRRTRRS